VTAALLTSERARRKAVLDTCAVFQDEIWREQVRERVRTWLGPDGISVLPARVITEIVRVAADQRAAGSAQAAVAAGRAALALTAPEDLIGLGETKRAVLSRADVDRLCRDNADPRVVRREKNRHGRWVVVPGDGDFEIAHTVRVLTGASHEAVLVTRDGDLRDAAGRLGVALLDRGAPCAPPPGVADDDVAVTDLPDPAPGARLHLLGLNAAVALLADRLPELGGAGDSAVVLSSTLVRAAQRAVLDLPRGEDGEPDPELVAGVQRRLGRLLATGRVGGRQVPVHVWATPWEVYATAAERVTDPRFGSHDEEDRAWDMHTLLTLAAAEVLGQQGHRVSLADTSRDEQGSFVHRAARAWRAVGGLDRLDGLVRHPQGTRRLVDEGLASPDAPLDLSALLARFGRS
jgi:hypothetical protein